jgi:hypothetical protein
MQLRRRSVLAALAAGVAGAAGRPAVARQADPPRPRVLGSGGDFERIANVVDADEYEPNVSAWYGNVESRARDLLETDTVEYELPDGVRLLPISREVLSRVRTLGLVYRVSGDMVYASRAWRELEAAAAFDTWHPEHFLDVAEMTAAFGIAYDWLHDYLDASQRETVRTAMVEKGIDLGIAAHEGRGGVPNWWTDDEFNWNSVCNGGLSVGACALVGEDGVDQRKLETLLSYTSAGILHAFENFGEDGGWPEGYNYWGYNTRYQAYYLTSMLNTLSGADLDVEAGIPDVDGFPVAGNFPMAMTGIRGVFNYADAGSSPKSNSVLFWLARQFDEPAWRPSTSGRSASAATSSTCCGTTPTPSGPSTASPATCTSGASRSPASVPTGASRRGSTAVTSGSRAGTTSTTTATSISVRSSTTPTAPAGRPTSARRTTTSPTTGT